MEHPWPPQCDGCPLKGDSPKRNPTLHGKHIPPKGPLGADILAVGMSGGEEEEELGEPFVGPSGRKLKGALDVMADYREYTLRKYNLVNCRTKRVGLGGTAINRDPTATEIKNCTRRWLLPELVAHPPKLLLPLGAMAYEFLTFFTPEKKGTLSPPTGTLSKGGKIPGGFAGTFQQGIGHRIVVPRDLYRQLKLTLTPKKERR